MTQIEKRQKSAGIRLLDVGLVAGAAVVGVVVLFAALHFVEGLIWFGVKIVVLLAVIGGVVHLLRRSRR
ncbi:MAG: hypothetical protein ACYCTL_06840 [Acidimicrobiales bacterium]|jgi:hypothetical protein